VIRSEVGNKAAGENLCTLPANACLDPGRLRPFNAITDQTSSLRFIEVNWNLGFIDGTTLPPGQPLGSYSFDQLAGSILNMFDFDDPPNLSCLFLDPLTGTIR